jgi:hypothetical protein
MYAIVNHLGQIELSAESQSDLIKKAEAHYPKHTTVYTVGDPDARIDNPPGGEASASPPTAELAMLQSGLPWNPSAKRPTLKHVKDPLRGQKGVGITMADVLAEYPMTREGLIAAHRDLLEFFPNKKGEYGYNTARTPAGISKMVLRTNVKTKKAILGAKGEVLVPPSFAVGVTLLPYSIGPKLSREPAEKAQKRYDEATKDYRLQMPIKMRTLPLVEPNRKMVTVCVGASAECMATCLVFSGQNKAVKHNDYSKLATTRALFFRPLAFARVLMNSIQKHVAYCEKNGLDPYVRMNVYSDIPWELYFPELFDWCAENFPKLRLYDYTKVIGRGALPFPNYDLTFSYSGTPRNLEYVRKALASGQRVAMVFLRNTHMDKRPADKLTDIVMFSGAPSGDPTNKAFLGYPVIDGDYYDMRPLDPAPVVVGLRYKTPREIERTHGAFVVDAGRPKDKFIVHVNMVDGQWVTAVTPEATGVSLVDELNSLVA